MSQAGMTSTIWQRVQGGAAAGANPVEGDPGILIAQVNIHQSVDQLEWLDMFDHCPTGLIDRFGVSFTVVSLKISSRTFLHRSFHQWLSCSSTFRMAG